LAVQKVRLAASSSSAVGVRLEQEPRDRVGLVDRRDLAGLPDEAFQACVLDADHVPVPVEGVRGERCLLALKQPPVVVVAPRTQAL